MSENENETPIDISVDTEAPSETPQDEPFIETRTAITSGLLAEMYKKARIILLCMLILGSVLLVGFIVGSVVYEMLYEVEPSWGMSLLIVGAVLFGVGLICYLSINKSIKSVKNQENRYVFSEQFFTVHTYENGEERGFAKHYYSDVDRVRHTEHYFLFHIPQGYYAVVLESLTDRELAMLCAKFGYEKEIRKNK